MMKLVAVNGSPHGMTGSTGKLLQGVLDGAAKAGAEISTFLLAELKVAPCRDCAYCHRAGTCQIDDDFARVRAAMLEADGVVFASPNYLRSASAQLKCVMDRSSGLLHCQMLEGKYGAAVVTSGGPESAEVERYILGYIQSLGAWTVGSVGAEAREMLASAEPGHAARAAAELGRKIVEAAESKATFPDQVVRRQAFFNRMRTLIMARKAEWPFEHEYWRSRGRV